MAWLAAGAQVAARRPLDTAGFAFAAFGCLAILINALFLQSGLHPAPLIPFKPRPVAQQATPKEATGATNGATGPTEAVMPRPRPIDLSRTNAVAAPAPQQLVPAAADVKPKLEKSEVVSEIQKELARRGRYDGTSDGIWGPKTIAAARDFAQQAHSKVAIEPNELLLRAIVRTPAKPAAVTAQVPLPPAPVAAAPVVPVRSAPVEAIAPPAPVPVSTGNRRLMNAQRALSDFGYGQIKPTGQDDAATRQAIQAFERERNLPVTGRLSDSVARELATTTGRSLD